MKIIQVWNSNTNDAFKAISRLINKYNYISMDTEFPGTVVEPFISYNLLNDCCYQTLKSNVDLLQIIQLGISVGNQHGKCPFKKSCWQFNFFFDSKIDMFAQNSIDLLVKSEIIFEKHKKKGIYINEFVNLLIRSGLVFNQELKWISFHSGYDFGYLIKILTRKSLPIKKKFFIRLFRFYFPCSYDVKYLNVYSDGFFGGLDKIAQKLNIFRLGCRHQAGSDSLLTLKIFFKLKKIFFSKILCTGYQGFLYELNISNGNQINKNNFFFKNIGCLFPLVLF